MYLITYMGEHTCKNLSFIHNLIMPSNSISEPSSIISFGSNTSNITQELPLPSSALLSQRQEADEEVLSNPNLGTSDSSEFLDLPDLYEGSLVEPDNGYMSFVDDWLNLVDLGASSEIEMRF